MDGFGQLTREHGVRVETLVSVEDCSLIVGEIVGHVHVVSASRMNKAVVLFLSSVEKARQVIRSGIVIRGSLTPVLPLAGPSRKIILSNVPPFLSDEQIAIKLSQYGKLVSPIRKIPVGCKSPLLKHLMSFRRQVYVILKHGYHELKTQFTFNVGGFDYPVYVTSNTTMKCFGCGSGGHLVRDCPKEPPTGTTDPPETDPPMTATDPPVADPPVVDPHLTASPAAESPANGSSADPAAEPGPDAAETGLDAEGAKVEGAVLADYIGFDTVAVPRVADLISLESDAESCSQPTNAETERHDLVSDIVTDMESEFKVPKNKRKSQQKTGSASKQKKRESDTDVTDDEEVASDSSWSECSQTDISRVVYTADQMKEFLTNTKGQRDVLVVKFFPDLQQFVRDANCWLREGAIPKPDYYRLRKRVSEIRKALHPKAAPTELSVVNDATC